MERKQQRESRQMANALPTPRREGYCDVVHCLASPANLGGRRVQGTVVGSISGGKEGGLWDHKWSGRQPTTGIS